MRAARGWRDWVRIVLEKKGSLSPPATVHKYRARRYLEVANEPRRSHSPVEFEQAVRVTVFDYAALKSYIAGLLDGRVDMAKSDAIHAFRCHRGLARLSDWARCLLGLPPD